MSAEHKIQAECFQWHWNHFPKERGRLFMVYNNPKNKAHGSILKSLGMVAGVSDLCFVAYNGRSVFLECKTMEGEQMDKQKWFEGQVTQSGAAYHIFRSLEEFKQCLKLYQAPVLVKR